jgi:hypothetical protein
VGAIRSTTRRTATSSARPRPSALRGADRRAHLLEQEVTLAYLRELAASAAPRR